MFATRGHHGPTYSDQEIFSTTVYPRSPNSDWREIAIRAGSQAEAERIAMRVEEGGYSGIFLVSPARACARLVDEWGRVFRVGNWPREDGDGSDAGAAADAASG